MYSQESEQIISSAYSNFPWNEIVVEEFNKLCVKYQVIINKNPSKISKENFSEYEKVYNAKYFCSWLLSKSNPKCIKSKFDNEDIEYFGSRKYYTVNYWVEQYKAYLTYFAKYKSNPENYKFGFVIPKKYLDWNQNLMAEVLEGMVK